MARIGVRSRAVDVEEHHLRLGVLRVPVGLRVVDEGLVVEDVADLGIQTGRIVRQESAERRREEQIERGLHALGEASRHGRDQFFRRGEMLGDDQLPRSLTAHDVEQPLALILRIRVADLARRRRRTKYSGKLFSAGLVHRMVAPPSTLMTWPLIQAPSSESKCTTVAAISSGAPRRVLRVRASAACFTSSGMVLRLFSVSTRPGATALARIPCRPQREATWRIRAFTPALAIA